MLSVHTHYAEEICERRFHSENTSNVFRRHHAGDIWEHDNQCRWFWICVWGKSSQGNHDAIVFEKLRFQNVLCLHWGAEPVFSNSFSLTSVFEKLRFHGGLVWTVGLTVEIKLRFQITPARCGRYLNLPKNRTQLIRLRLDPGPLGP